MRRPTKEDPSADPRSRSGSSATTWRVVLVVLLPLLFAGCGGGTGPGPTTPEPLTERTEAEVTSTPKLPPVNAQAPEPWAELTSVNDPGRVNVISNGNGFSIVDSVISLN